MTQLKVNWGFSSFKSKIGFRGIFEFLWSWFSVDLIIFFLKQQLANESAMEEELGLIGASAEDTEAELIRKICETELLAGK